MKVTNVFSRLLSVMLIPCWVALVSVALGQPAVRIMPLGDSITKGFDVDSTAEGGYRNSLYTQLTGLGFNLDFVGTLADHANPGLADTDHEGHAGFTINQLRTPLAFYLKSSDDPDVILLHIGTNDFWNGSTLAVIQDRFRSLLAELSELRPHAKIIVSSLIPRTDSFETVQDQFNQSLPGIVAVQASLGRKVSFVDLHAALDTIPADLGSDGVHPSLNGYAKMADGWLPAIQSVITPSGTADLPAISRVDARGDLQSLKVIFSKPIKDADVTSGNFALTGGVTVSTASLDASKRVVMLGTSTQSANTIYTLTVSGVHDRMVPENLITPGSQMSFTSRTLVDGSFEDDDVAWVKTGNAIISGLGGPAASDGKQLAVFNDNDSTNDGEIAQNIVTVPGTKYRLQFDMGVSASGTQAQSLQVKAEDAFATPGTTVFFTDSWTMNGIGGGATTWAIRSVEFEAVSTMTTVTFSDLSSVTASVDLLLDDVRLEAVIVWLSMTAESERHSRQ